MEKKVIQKPTFIRCELIKNWHNHYGYNPPKGISTQTLSLAYAYTKQSTQNTTLSPRILTKLLAPSENKAAPLHKIPGVRLVRKWHDREYVVDVLPDGYLYQDKTYRSLSEIAKLITGTHWSGPRFFKVKLK